jgi:hypothetical protein
MTNHEENHKDATAYFRKVRDVISDSPFNAKMAKESPLIAELIDEMQEDLLIRLSDYANKLRDLKV